MLRRVFGLCGLLCAIALPARAAEVNVGAGTITKLRYYTDQHVNGQALVVEMSGTVACNTRTSYSIRLDDRNQHIYSGLLSAFLAGKTVEVAVENSDTTVSGRCRIISLLVS